MIISKQGDYAIRTMLALGQKYPESISIKQIAGLQEIPKPFLNYVKKQPLFLSGILFEGDLKVLLFLGFEGREWR